MIEAVKLRDSQGFRKDLIKREHPTQVQAVPVVDERWNPAYPGQYVRAGWWNIQAYSDGKEVVILGIPPDEESETEEDAHSCDAMGCGFDHVIARFPLQGTPYYGKEKRDDSGDTGTGGG